MRRLFGMLYQVKLYILIKHNVYTMKGFVIKIELYAREPEISRKLIIPEKTTFTELQKIIKKYSPSAISRIMASGQILLFLAILTLKTF